MNLPQTKILLEKIISLYKTVSADEKNISTIERDLMLSYIRQLYEAVVDNSATPPSVLPADRQVAAIPKPVQPVVSAPPPPKSELPKVEVPKPEPQRVVTPPPVVTPPQPPISVEPPPTYTAPKAVEYQAYMPPPQEQPKPVQVAATSSPTHISADVATLFELNEGKELSDKLSNTAILDLTKVFGFNDKLLMQNELFGGDKAVFDEAVRELNNSNGYEAANTLLVSMASKYHWTANDDRKKHAKAFIKLVRRRFKS